MTKKAPKWRPPKRLVVCLAGRAGSYSHVTICDICRCGTLANQWAIYCLGSLQIAVCRECVKVLKNADRIAN